jgi:hypothetical protein
VARLGLYRLIMGSELRLVWVVLGTLLLLALGTDGVARAAPESGGQLTVSPDPVPVGTDTLTISGSGFASGKYLINNVSGAFPSAEAMTNCAGAFTISWTRWGGGFKYEFLIFGRWRWVSLPQHSPEPWL